MNEAYFFLIEESLEWLYVMGLCKAGVKSYFVFELDICIRKDEFKLKFSHSYMIVAIFSEYNKMRLLQG